MAHPGAAPPPYPVPAVRLIIADREGRILVLRRRSAAYGDGAWCLPGGKVDYGETVEQTVSKELREETGLACSSARFLFYQDSLPMVPGGMHCINFYFACSVSGTVALNDESSSFAWLSREDLASRALAFRNDEGLRRYWAESA
ncbi:NUDIX hydrolase [Accumulibacter sp.]|uniref:NUDIX hydrolase n=1 Tax=Accumulibacter sp. TaxID=2053492 RepID=UPI0035B40DC2